MGHTTTEKYRCHWQCDWLSVEILITFTPNYLASYDHLTIQSINPQKHPLPITETGYRSHFAPHGEMQAQGDLVETVCTMLDCAAERGDWKQQLNQQRQGQLL